MSWDDADFSSDDPLVRYNAHQAAKGRPQMPDPDEVRKSQKEHPTIDEDKFPAYKEWQKKYVTDTNDFLKSMGTDMNEMAEIQEKIERGEIADANTHTESSDEE